MFLQKNEYKQRKVVPETEYNDILIRIVQFGMERKKLVNIDRLLFECKTHTEFGIRLVER